MKVYHSRNKPTSRWHKTVIAVTVVFVVWVSALVLPKVITTTVAYVLLPMHVVQTWLRESESEIPYWVRDRATLVAQIKELETAMVVAANQGASNSRLIEENKQLRILLSATSTPRIAATVIARPPTVPYDVFQIDRGSWHGVALGAPVFVGYDQVLGTVTYVTPSYSLVTLFSTPGFETTTYITGANVVVTLEGVGGGVARVRLPQGVTLSQGDLVILPSLEPGFFGRVDYIQTTPSQPEQYGYVSSHTSLQSVYLVSVGTEAISAPTPADITALRQATTTPLLSPALSSYQDISSTTATTTTEEDTVDQ